MTESKSVAPCPCGYDKMDLDWDARVRVKKIDEAQVWEVPCRRCGRKKSIAVTAGSGKMDE